MLLGGLPFPYDRGRNTSGHGPVASFILRTHPFALWGVAAVVGAIVGWFR
jgi:hypothetical protein